MAEMFEELQHLITGLQPVSMGLYKDFATELGKFTGQLIAWLEMDGMARLKDKVELQAAAHLCRTLVVLTNQRNEPEIWQSYGFAAVSAQTSAYVWKM
ncbi:hypothetical protein FRC09_007248 [Ceratobasidium sp. 395]|nr:hypothetical protein FRC09_007248 [Ceratobasidium sp. 395]